jgi:hypothetical protein
MIQPYNVGNSFIDHQISISKAHLKRLAGGRYPSQKESEFLMSAKRPPKMNLPHSRWTSAQNSHTLYNKPLSMPGLALVPALASTIQLLKFEIFSAHSPW